MAAYILGIDIGTTSVKAILLSNEGKIVDESTKEHDLLSLHANWAEEDANIWWQNTLLAVSDLTARNRDRLPDLKAIGCSGMVPAIVFLDEHNVPLRNTIQQNDARAIDQIDRITKALDQETLFARTGGYTNQQHILPRILWVKENEPDVFAKTKTVMGSYDYIAFKLTGIRQLEMNWAVESGAFDVHTREWIGEYLTAFGIDPAILPPVSPSMQVIGKTLPGIAGLPAGIPVISGSADHVASTLAAGITEPGDLLIKFGGAGDILYCTDTVKPHPLLFFDYHIVPERYLLNGCMASSGSLVKWYTRDILSLNDKDTFRKLDEEAESVPPASDGLFILPYFIGEKTPLFDPTARGVFVGLTLAHNRGAIFRAILESVIYGFRHHVDVLREAGYSIRRVYATNGGAKSRFWCQIAADVLGEEIVSFPAHPGSALGVAFLAGMAVGVFQSWEEIHTCLTERRTFRPIAENKKIYDRAYPIFRNLYTALTPSFAAINKLYEE